MSLEELRKKIDEADAQIVKLLAERVRIAEEIGKEKEGQNKEVEDRGREQVVLEKVKSIARRENINEKQFIYHGMTNKALKNVEISKRNDDLCPPDVWYECHKQQKCQRLKSHKKKNFQKCKKVHIIMTRKDIGDDYEHRWHS